MVTKSSSEFLAIGTEAKKISSAEFRDEVTQAIRNLAEKDEVYKAILTLAEKNEVDILKLASEDRLKEIFPYEARATHFPELESWDDVAEAPNRRLTDEEYKQFLLGKPLKR
jgi:hypothetical protein